VRSSRPPWRAFGLVKRACLLRIYGSESIWELAWWSIVVLGLRMKPDALARGIRSLNLFISLVPGSKWRRAGSPRYTTVAR
jgi:hypothetical protein